MRGGGGGGLEVVGMSGGTSLMIMIVIAMWDAVDDN